MSQPVPLTLTGNVVDVVNERIFYGTITIEDGRIANIKMDGDNAPRESASCFLPGFVDAHVHVESSLLTPAEFARIAVTHGTVAAVSDPHEIANVLGVMGVEFMLNNARSTPFKFRFGAPSCVPATVFETAGADVKASEVVALLERDDIGYLSEMMNFPGVLNGDGEVRAKIDAAKRVGKPVDGHAPGLRGEAARAYAAAGISTDHECTSRAEAEDKLANGMRILIREGSAARNYAALAGLIADYPDRCMFCSDDKHPNELVAGHIDRLVRRAICDDGLPLMPVLRAACVTPVRHYGLPVGLLQPGDPADLIEVSDLHEFAVRRTFLNGVCVAENGETRLRRSNAPVMNRFEARPMTPDAFALAPVDKKFARVIVAEEGQIVTGRRTVPVADATPAKGILKIAVVNRYQPNVPPALGFIDGFGAMRGAIASSVAHDSHNIVAVGANDEDLCLAINKIVAYRGGLAVACAADGIDAILPLPIAGLMTFADGFETARRYEQIDALAKSLGTPLDAPFMTLSFMALLVIPTLKMSDKGLFDGEKFAFVDVFTDEADA